MIFGIISYFGKSKLYFHQNNVDSEEYIIALKKTLQPFIKKYYKQKPYIFL